MILREDDARAFTSKVTSRTWTSSSPGAGAGTGFCTYLSGLVSIGPGSLTTHARIVFALPTVIHYLYHDRPDRSWPVSAAKDTARLRPARSGQPVGADCWAVLVSDTPQAAEMRQNSPFTGILTADERRGVLESFKRHWQAGQRPTSSRRAGRTARSRSGRRGLLPVAACAWSPTTASSPSSSGSTRRTSGSPTP